MTVIVLHSTESDIFGVTNDYLGAHPGIQPHVLIDPATGQSREYIPWSSPAKSLVNLPGGVETNNRGGVIQVEVILRAAEAPARSTEWYLALASMLQDIAEATGAPVSFPVPFVAYPASYGLGAAQRLSEGAWRAVAGIIGHQHVPENVHGDPGDVNRLIPIMLTANHHQEPTTMPGIALLGPSMTTVSEIYAAHGLLPTNSEIDSWRLDLLAKLRIGEDLEPTFAYIDWALQ
jgi:hypothetical protein